MAAQRVAEQVLPEDSASAVGSTTSWSVVHEVPMQNPAPKAPPPGFKASPGQFTGDTAQEGGGSSSADLPEVPPNVRIPTTAAPATQAAKGLMDDAEAQRLARQKDKARGKQHRIRWGQMRGRGPRSQNFQLPNFIQQVGSGENERSVLVIDNRDKRIQSPFQGWLLDEILLNAQSGVNILADRQLARSPDSGYHMNLFYMRTINGYKFIMIGSMTSYEDVPCAHWDQPTAEVMAHDQFQPFRWPLMTAKSSTWVDVKIKVEGGLLLQLELRGYRSDRDMTVQLNYLDDGLAMELRDQLFVPSCIVTIFQGWRVVATSFEVGGRLYACSDGGIVVALDYPLCHFEARLTTTSSTDSIGFDADRVEFRFRSSGDAIDVSCSAVDCGSDLDGDQQRAWHSSGAECSLVP